MPDSHHPNCRDDACHPSCTAAISDTPREALSPEERKQHLTAIREATDKCKEGGHIGCSLCDISFLLSELDRRAQEHQEAINEARAWAEKTVREVAEQRVVTCVYCGHEYPKGTPAAQDAALTAHIETCEQHPMAKLKSRHAEEIRKAKEEGWDECLGKYCGLAESYKYWLKENPHRAPSPPPQEAA